MVGMFAAIQAVLSCTTPSAPSKRMPGFLGEEAERGMVRDVKDYDTEMIEATSPPSERPIATYGPVPAQLCRHSSACNCPPWQGETLTYIAMSFDIEMKGMYRAIRLSCHTLLRTHHRFLPWLRSHTCHSPP